MPAAVLILVGDDFGFAGHALFGSHVSVSPMTPHEASEITQLRSIIESQALAWAIPAMTKLELDAAGRVLRQLDAATRVDQMISLNSQFHEILYAPARRERTLSLIRSLRLNFERYLRFTWAETDYITKSQQEHLELLALCRVRNVDDATKLLRQHILGTGALLVERLDSRPV